MRTMIGQVAGDTAVRWFVYLLVAAFGAWAVVVLAAIGRAVGARPRASRSEGIVPMSHARSHEKEPPNV
jgi:hypothetical protein